MNQRVRRAPPPFRRVTVSAVERRTPRLVRVTLAGDELEGLEIPDPAMSVRLLVPRDDEIPTWRGNEFLYADDSRPAIRTFTPSLSSDKSPGGDELAIEVVDHGDGAASTWARDAKPGAHAAISGPGRGYAIDPDAPAFLLAGDETAIPAIGQLMQRIPDGIPTRVLIEVAQADAQVDMPGDVEWLPGSDPPGDALLRAVQESTVDGKVWAAGEAAAVQRIRKHLFEERGLERADATVRGYWKHGRAGGGDSD